MITSDLVNDSSAYLASKRRDPATGGRPSPVSHLIHALDDAVIDYLNHGGPYAAVEEAINTLITDPQSDWTLDRANYYIRVRHYS